MGNELHRNRQTYRVFKIRMIFEIILLSIFDRRMMMYKEEYCVLSLIMSL